MNDRPKYCIPIKENDPRIFMEKFNLAQNRADVVEIWFQQLEKADRTKVMEELKKNKQKPLLFKCEMPESKLPLGIFDYIDFDFTVPVSRITTIKNQYPELKIILSYHNFDLTPDNESLNQIVDEMVEKGADIIKLATFANSYADSLRMLNFLEKLSTAGKQTICISMGEKGKITRIIGHLFGNILMYAPLNAEDLTAPGQITREELEKIYKLME